MNCVNIGCNNSKQTNQEPESFLDLGPTRKKQNKQRKLRRRRSSFLDLEAYQIESLHQIIQLTNAIQRETEVARLKEEIRQVQKEIDETRRDIKATSELITEVTRTISTYGGFRYIPATKWESLCQRITAFLNTPLNLHPTGLYWTSPPAYEYPPIRSLPTATSSAAQPRNTDNESKEEGSSIMNRDTILIIEPIDQTNEPDIDSLDGNPSQSETSLNHHTL